MSNYYDVKQFVVPDSLKTSMNSVLNKKLGTTSVNYDPRTWAANVGAMVPLPVKTATGTIAHFTDGADDVPIAEGVFDFNPIQTGTGDPSPTNPRPITGFTGLNVTRCGANLWDEEWLHGYYDRNNQGAFVPQASCICSKNMISVKPSTSFYWAIDYTGSVSGRVLYYDRNGDYLSASEATAPKATFTTPNDCYFIHFYFYIPSGYGSDYGDNVSINYPSTDTTYHAYTGHVYPISWTSEGTKYGGSYNSETGELVIDRGFVLIDSASYLSKLTGKVYRIDTSKVPDALWASDNINKLNCEKFKPQVTDQQIDIIYTTINGFIIRTSSTYQTTNELIEVVGNFGISYPLVTPVEIQLEPTEMATLLGVNNFYHDGNGDSTIEYRADLILGG